MIWDEDPFDPGHWSKLGVNVDHMLHGNNVIHLSDSEKAKVPTLSGRGPVTQVMIGSTGNLWEAIVSKLAVVNKRRELVQSEEIRNDPWLLKRRRERHRVKYHKNPPRVPKITKNCLVCNSEFLAYRVDQKFCTPYCAKKNYEERHKEERKSRVRGKNGHN